MLHASKSALLPLIFSLASLSAQAQSSAPATVGAPAASSKVPAYLGQHQSNAADLEAIMQVTRDFQAALISKDTKKLSSLLLNNKILFASPASPEHVKTGREKFDVHFDGIETGGAIGFIGFIANTKEAVEEKFYNIKITQDGHVAWVSFDFEFLENNKVENYGVEAWQLLKTPDRGWKIFSVTWSSHGAPK